MAKNTILVYTDLMEQLEELSLEERGIILTAMIKYQMGEELPKMSKLLKLVFIPIRQSIDRDNDAYERKCEKNRENGKLGGRPKNQTVTSETERFSEKPKKADNDNENDIDNDNGSDSGNDNADIQPLPALTQRELDRIMDAWNNQKCTLDIKGFTKKRIKEISFLVNGNLEKFLDVIKSLNKQQYLIDQADKNMPTHFDWFLDPENYQSVIEGKYEKKYGTGDGYGLARDW